MFGFILGVVMIFLSHWALTKSSKNMFFVITYAIGWALVGISLAGFIIA